MSNQCRNLRFVFLFKSRKWIYSRSKATHVNNQLRRIRQMGNTMDEMKRLEAENQKLKEDNEMLLNIVVQMKVTLNRLVNRYVTEQP